MHISLKHSAQGLNFVIPLSKIWKEDEKGRKKREKFSVGAGVGGCKFLITELRILLIPYLRHPGS